MFQIHVVADHTFPMPNRLQRVDISKNCISLVEKYAFRGLYHLEQLNLQNNRIKAIYLGDIPSGASVFLQDNDIQDLSQLHDRINQGSYAMYQYRTRIPEGKK